MINVGGSSRGRGRRGKSRRREETPFDDFPHQVEYNHLVILVLLHHLKVVKVIIHHITNNLLIYHMCIIYIYQTQMHLFIINLLQITTMTHQQILHMTTNKLNHQEVLHCLIMSLEEVKITMMKVIAKVMILHIVLPCGN